MGWRKRKDISFAVGPVLEKKVDRVCLRSGPAHRTGAEPSHHDKRRGAVRLSHHRHRTETEFQRRAGACPSGHTHSICTVDHAEQTWGVPELPSRSARSGRRGARRPTWPGVRDGVYSGCRSAEKETAAESADLFNAGTLHRSYGPRRRRHRKLDEDEFVIYSITPIVNASIKEVHPGKRRCRRWGRRSSVD